MEDWDKAAQEYEKAIIIDANYKDVQTRLAEVKTKLTESEATATAEALETHYQKGLAYINLEKWVEAKAELEKVFSVDPNYKEVRAKLAEVEAQMAKLTPTAPPTPPTPPTLPTPPTSTSTSSAIGVSLWLVGGLFFIGLGLVCIVLSFFAKGLASLAGLGIILLVVGLLMSMVDAGLAPRWCWGLLLVIFIGLLFLPLGRGRRD